MTKFEYLQARRRIRDNGRYALRWLTPAEREIFDHLLFNIQDSTDELAERAEVVAWCHRTGTPYTFANLRGV